MSENPNAIKNLVATNGNVTFDYGENTARVQAVNDHLLRLTVVPAGTDWPVHPSVPVDAEAAKHNDQTVATGGSGQQYDADIVTASTSIPLTLSGDTATLGDYTVHFNVAGRIEISRDTTLIVKQGLPALKDGAWKSRLNTTGHPAYFGAGTQNGISALNGLLVQIKNENRWTTGGVTSPVPFYWSTTGYGVLVNSFTPGEYDFSNPHAGVMLEHADLIYDAYIILGATPAALIHGYHELTGLPNLLPRFALYPAHFNAYNRDYWVAVTPDSAGAIKFEDGQYYKEYQPVNPLTFNTGYRAGTITVNDLTLIPNVYGSGAVTFTTTDAAGNPTVAIHESLNGEHDYQFSGRAVIDRYRTNDFPLGWFLPNDGYGAGYGQSDTFAGDLDNLHSFTEYAQQNGVATGLWTQAKLKPDDMNAPQKGERSLASELDIAGIQALKTDVAWVGEGYTFGLNATEIAGAMMTERNLRPAIVTLDGWAGTQRNALVWSGDQSGSDWQNIQAHVGTYLSTGLSGNPNVASDIDGIYAGADPVIQTRDLQWKSFTPTFFAMDGWGDQPKVMGMQAGAPFADINRSFLRYHTQLVPYLTTLLHTARATGAPVIRPTFWLEQTAYTVTDALNDQLLIGDDLLIAPLTSAYGLQNDGSGKRAHLYLPTGTWFDFWTGATIAGGRTLSDVDTPLNQLPVYVRAGAILPLVPAHQNPGAMPAARVVEYHPGPASTFTVVADDGQTMAYQDDTVARTQINAATTVGGCDLTIEPTTGTYTGITTIQPLTIFIASAKKPHAVNVTIDGQAVTADWQFGQRPHDVFTQRTETGVTITLGAVALSSQVTVSVAG